MTREEAIIQCLWGRIEALEETIKSLEQEPILDKITEIIEPLRHLSIDEMSDIEWQTLQVIDKYKAESVEQEHCDCSTCVNKDEVDGSNCYECVKGIRNNYKTESEE